MLKIRRRPTRNNPVEGVVDGLEGSALRGWAWVPDVPDEAPLHVEVRSGDRVWGTAEAHLFRPDLAQAEKRGGYCGFVATLGPMPPAGTELTITAVTPDGMSHGLQGSPLTIPALPHGMADRPGNTDVLPIPISTTDLCGSLDQCGPARIRGWAYWLAPANRPLSLSLHESGREILRLDTNQWRGDLAELRQGDGCCGFEAALPPELCDGELHTLDLRRSDTGATVLARPFTMRVLGPGIGSAQHSPGPAPLSRTPVTQKVTLSVIVNFYNMRREAERTLTSLSQRYQEDAQDFDYEVLCIDNGSNPPLDPAWIASFGPQFRLLRPSRQLASPCAAINEAALQARGDYLAIMIDGAHLLTPGVFRAARQTWTQHADAVVAVRHWFVGGDQRWLAVAGYSQHMEDRLFERIQWPNNGYELFRISAPIGEGPEPWLEGLSESNCLMLPTSLYDRIGGMDEAFDQAGGGFANLDLWHRASENARGPLVSLVGEASFHQFHGGTTTNVEDTEKDVRVRSYANAYRALRGKEFNGVPPSRLQFHGSLRSEFATGIRQRSLIPLRLGITGQIRPGQLPVHFDDGAQTYLQSVYAECGLQESVTWMGEPAGVAPADLMSLQEIIHQLRPDAIIAVGAEAGLIGFIDSTLCAMRSEGSRMLCVNPVSLPAMPMSRLTVLHEQADDMHTLATVRHWTGSAESVLVLYDVMRSETLSLASLQAYGALVSYRSYLVCLGTLFGQPWLGYSNRDPLQIVREFARNSTFVIDRSWNRQLISTCPFGYLRKIGGTVNAIHYDPALDEIPSAPSLRENA
ncbi:CmcI family methyltransferase [Dyella psychrodurans]|uniref:Glycosyltransferase n=1 Tax=Dyella psychrodurans TaxID=1927960 RepID=A0A370X4Q5_9GAMM|nr:CmcI family methyltransferase [Dyella psychrodurans]RDS83403.1 glycosyltransferase [Dyella psychrodurans]